ncbi:MAG: protein kinase [Chloroflexaceae bacterium]|nr:protein kinase [Chloroflexaceae bacterium]
MHDPSALIGQRLGPYEILSRIGSGGMSTVYRGLDHNLQRPVAIKVLSPHLGELTDLPERFRQEARMIARLNHPNIVSIYNFGEQNGLMYLVEELLEGPTLGAQMREWIATGRPYSRNEIVTIIRQLASALDAAHAAGIIHRDVKPENAIWNGQGNLVLTDFGIARLVQPDVRYTQTGMLIGTPSYLSPEQAQGRPLTPASDIYAMGVILYELIAGRLPFDSTSAAQLLIDHLQTPPPALPRRSDVPAAVNDIVQQALAKQPDQRFNNAGALARALEQAWTAGATPPVVPPVDVHSQPTEAWTPPPSQYYQYAPPATPRPEPRYTPPEQYTPRPERSPPPPTPAVDYRTAAEPPYEQEQRRGGGGMALPILLGIVGLFVVAGAIVALLLNSSGPAPVAGVATATPTATLTATPTETPTASAAPSATATEEVVLPTPTSVPIVPLPEVGELAFASERNGPFHILTMQGGDGSGMVDLMFGGAESSYGPTWSPDGQTIAFHSNRDGDFEIYLMNANGSDVRQITDNDFNDQEAAWSPSGDLIAFRSNRNGNWDITVMRPDGSGRVLLTEDFADDFAPAWSPDGSQIAFTSNRGGQDDVYIMQRDGNNLRNSTDHPASDKEPTWSPDGQALAFVSDRSGNQDIYMLNLNSGELRNLTEHPAQDVHPAWSPDGRLMAFTTNRDGNDEIYISNIDGSNPRNLSNHPGSDWDAAWSR